MFLPPSSQLASGAPGRSAARVGLKATSSGARVSAKACEKTALTSFTSSGRERQDAGSTSLCPPSAGSAARMDCINAVSLPRKP